MSARTYTNRFVTWDRVASISGGTLTGAKGWSCSPSPETLSQLTVGDDYGVETIGGPFGRICGYRTEDRWLSRKSDQQLDRERQEQAEQSARERRENLAKNRAAWTARDEVLPDWLHDRIAVFHKRGGEGFREQGWAYELVVCELAASYAASNCEDTAEIDAYAREHGTSGNQHDCARALARAHLAGRSLKDTVSALSPITGDAFYEENR